MNLWHLFQKLRPFVRPYRLLVIATLVLTLIGSLTAQVNALTLQYAVDRINALIEAGQGLSAGWHILITISAILLGKEIINAFVQFDRSFMVKNYVFLCHKIWHRTLLRNFCVTDWPFLIRTITKQVNYKHV